MLRMQPFAFRCNRAKAGGCALLIAALCASADPAWAQSPCRAETLSWRAQAQGSAGSAFVASLNTPVTVTLAGKTQSLTSGTPLIAAFYQGDYGTVPNPTTGAYAQYLLAVTSGLSGGNPIPNSFENGDSLTTTFTLGVPGSGVAHLRFKIFDLDGENSGSIVRQEILDIRGFLGTTAVVPTLTPGGVQSVAGSIATGISPAAAIKGAGISNTAGVLSVAFD